MSEKEKKPKKEKKAKGEKKPKVRVCPSCQAEVSKKAKVCPHCEAKLKKQGSRLPLLLVVLVLLIAVAAGVSVFVFHFPIDPPFELAFGGKAPSKSLMGETMELTVDQEKAMLAVLQECGFSELSEVTKIKSGATSTSYSVHDAATQRYVGEGDAIVMQVKNETKEVETITFQDHDIYVRGNTVSKITDYYLDTDQRDVYLAATLTAVKARLELPETAVFPSKSKWTYTMEGENVTVESFVTTHDGSGEETTRQFVARFESGEFASLEFLEEESGE